MSKARLKLIIVLAVCMVACLITAGCSIGLNDINDYRDYYNVTSLVTYYGNGGYFRNAYITSRTLEYTTGATFYEIPKDETTSASSSSTTSSNSMVTRANYNLLGWYEVDQRFVETETDEEDEDGEKIILRTIYFVLDMDDDDMAATAAYEKADADTYTYTYSDTTFSFVKDNFIENDGAWLMLQEDYDNLLTLQTNNSDSSVVLPPLADSGFLYTGDIIIEDDTTIYVVARWKVSACINYALVLVHGVDGYEADSITVTDKDGTETVYAEGDIISTEYYLDYSKSDDYYYIQRSDSSDTITETGASVNATLLGYYYDEDCTNGISGTRINKPDDDASEEELFKTVYALYIYGEWTPLRSASDISSLFNGKTAQANYYLMNDIDCNSVELEQLSTFSGRIEGNDHTLSSMTFTKTGLKLNASSAIFGRLMNGAQINNLILEDVTANYSTNGGTSNNYFYIYMLFSGVNSGASAKISGLTVKNFTMNITLGNTSATIGNIQEIEGVYETDNILYGMNNSVEETDEEFGALYGAATLDGYTVIINNETVLSTN